MLPCKRTLDAERCATQSLGHHGCDMHVKVRLTVPSWLLPAAFLSVSCLPAFLLPSCLTSYLLPTCLPPAYFLSPSPTSLPAALPTFLLPAAFLLSPFLPAFFLLPSSLSSCLSAYLPAFFLLPSSCLPSYLPPAYLPSCCLPAFLLPSPFSLSLNSHDYDDDNTEIVMAMMTW